jgi:hypothetical protein
MSFVVLSEYVPVAVSCIDAPAPTVVVPFIWIAVNVAGGVLTVMVVGALETPLYEALICVVPAPTPVTVPEPTDAAEALEDFQLAELVTTVVLLSE